MGLLKSKKLQLFFVNDLLDYNRNNHVFNYMALFYMLVTRKGKYCCGIQQTIFLLQKISQKDSFLFCFIFVSRALRRLPIICKTYKTTYITKEIALMVFVLVLMVLNAVWWYIRDLASLPLFYLYALYVQLQRERKETIMIINFNSVSNRNRRTNLYCFLCS